MDHFVSKSTSGEYCGMCYRASGDLVPAQHKVGEEIPYDCPVRRHNLTQYVCCQHFAKIMGTSVMEFTGCSIIL